MGQAQLLLIVLGVVLVGIAIIAGIQAYSTNNEKASVDAQVHDLMRVASDVQTWVQKPEQFGGPTAYAALDEVTFLTIGYSDATATEWTNPNATYTLAATASNVTITGVNDELDTYATAVVCGIKDTDILVATNIGGAPTAPTCPAG